MVDDYATPGLHKVRVKLKDGSVRIYYYAWRGGPPIVNEDGPLQYGSLEFLRLFRDLTKKTEIVETIDTLIEAYKSSVDYIDKAAKTRKDYDRYLAMIGTRFGTMPLGALEDNRVRGLFKRWRDSMAEKRRTADYAWSVLARLMSFSVDRGSITRNPCLRGGRIYVADRNDCVWKEEHLLQLFGVASPEVAAVVKFALWTGQRQADCLNAKWSDLQVGKIRVKQAKGGRRVMIPIGPPLAKLIESIDSPKDGTILLNSRGETWTSSGFRASFNKTTERAGIVDDLHFHDLRGTAVTRMALSGCSTMQIAAVTGHSVKGVDEILEAHYLGGRVELAEQAIEKLFAGTAP